MRVIAKSTLKKFWERPGRGDSRGPLESWHDEALKARWTAPSDIKSQFGGASTCGNKYRLVVEMRYRAGIAWVKFVGTHAQYDEIDVETINDY